MTKKIDDGCFHIWSACDFWGDQMFNLCAAKQLSSGGDVVIHTDKLAWSGATSQWYKINHEILRLWSSFDFVKGIVFDLSQKRPINEGCRNSYFNVTQALSEWGKLKSSYKHNIKDNINFDVLEKFDCEESLKNLIVNQSRKIAVFQPISILHKSKKDIISEYTNPWDQCISSLINLGYEIVTIGSEKDIDDTNEYYPNLLEKYPITNLMGKITMFQAIDLVINYSDFVLSCDSWSGWYGIASRTKTAVAAGKNFRNGNENGYVMGLGNDDIYTLDYSFEKEKCDLNLANWTQKNG